MRDGCEVSYDDYDGVAYFWLYFFGRVLELRMGLASRLSFSQFPVVLHCGVSWVGVANSLRWDRRVGDW